VRLVVKCEEFFQFIADLYRRVLQTALRPNASGQGPRPEKGAEEQAAKRY
jgi:hypothetical protein